MLEAILSKDIEIFMQCRKIVKFLLFFEEILCVCLFPLFFYRFHKFNFTRSFTLSVILHISHRPTVAHSSNNNEVQFLINKKW